jgi:hypothetical protein
VPPGARGYAPCVCFTHTDGADVLHSVPYYLAPLFALSDGCTGLSDLRCARVLTGCAFVSSERTPGTADAKPTCAAMHTIAGMGNFVRTVHLDEEVRVTLQGFLTTLKSQMATIAELKQCQALTWSASPSNSASLPSGIEGGASCGCDATRAACSGTARVSDARGCRWRDGVGGRGPSEHRHFSQRLCERSRSGARHVCCEPSHESAAAARTMPWLGPHWLRCGCRESQRAS